MKILLDLFFSYTWTTEQIPLRYSFWFFSYLLWLFILWQGKENNKKYYSAHICILSFLLLRLNKYYLISSYFFVPAKSLSFLLMFFFYFHYQCSISALLLILFCCSFSHSSFLYTLVLFINLYPSHRYPTLSKSLWSIFFHSILPCLRLSFLAWLSRA